MIFVDSNVFMYVVGRRHHLQDTAWQFLEDSVNGGEQLVTSSEVLQEFAHAYFPVGRQDSFDDAMNLIAGFRVDVWPLEREDVELARVLSEQHPTLQARGLCYLASCERRGVRQLMTFDESLRAAADVLQ